MIILMHGAVLVNNELLFACFFNLCSELQFAQLFHDCKSGRAPERFPDHPNGDSLKVQMALQDL